MNSESVQRFLVCAAKALGLAAGVPETATEVIGAGAAFPGPTDAKRTKDYAAKTNVGINYQSSGSGAA